MTRGNYQREAWVGVTFNIYYTWISPVRPTFSTTDVFPSCHIANKVNSIL